MRFKVLGEESPVILDGSKLLFCVIKNLPVLNKNNGFIVVAESGEPERNPNQRLTMKNLYIIGECDLTKIEELKKETNSKDENELFNKIIKKKVFETVDITKHRKTLEVLNLKDKALYNLIEDDESVGIIDFTQMFQ